MKSSSTSSGSKSLSSLSAHFFFNISSTLINNGSPANEEYEEYGEKPN